MLTSNNNPGTELIISRVKNVIITKSLLVRKFSGLVNASLFDTIDKKTRKRLNLISLLSIFKNRLYFWENDNYFFVLNLWARGYYHWMTEAAVKFVIFEKELKNAVIILPEAPPSFMQDFLAVWGINNCRIMKGNCFVKKLSVISNPVSGIPDTTLINELRRQLLNKVPDTDITYEYIYISRKLAKTRKVLNEEEVKNVLKEEGFFCVELENLPWKEQVNLFRRCRILISIHGAGLTNSIFMPPGSCVIEIYPESETGVTNPNLCYNTLGSKVGLYHSYLFSKRERTGLKPNFHLDNVEVDIEKLKTLLKEKNPKMA